MVVAAVAASLISGIGLALGRAAGVSDISTALVVSGVVTTSTAAAALLVVMRLSHTTAVSILWPARTPRPAQFFLGAAPPMIALGLAASLSYFIAGIDIFKPHAPATLLAVGAAILVAAVSEEIIFRGILFQSISGYFKSLYVGITISTIAFWIPHVQQSSLSIPHILIGIMLCYTTIQTHGIEFGSGYHASHNLLLYISALQLPDMVDTSPMSAFIFLSAFTITPVITVLYLHFRSQRSATHSAA